MKLQVLFLSLLSAASINGMCKTHRPAALGKQSKINCVICCNTMARCCLCASVTMVAMVGADMVEDRKAGCLGMACCAGVVAVLCDSFAEVSAVRQQKME